MPAATPTAASRNVEVVIDRLAPGGDGVGREVAPAPSASLGRATFVPLTAPGDRVLVSLGREKKRVAWGEVDTVLVPSSARVADGCAVFGRCGGCQWRHVAMAEQKRSKAEFVARALGVPQVELVSPVSDDGYRERARLHVDARGQLGFRERRGHALVAVTACPLFSPALARVLVALQAFLKGFPQRAELDGATVDLQQGTREGGDGEGGEDDGGVGVHLRWDLPRQGLLVLSAEQAWTTGLKEAGVVGVRVGPGEVDVGAPDIDVAEAGSPPLRIPAGGFAQVSRAANAALVAAVLEGVGESPGEVVELYAGSGNFTRHLVRRASRVRASDGDRAAVARGRVAVPGAVWSSDVAAGANAAGVAPQVVVLDPPRAGADEVHLAVAARATERIVYVSCDPQTLGRDAQALRAAGFVLHSVKAFDLMPQTFHVETVAVFGRSRASSSVRTSPRTSTPI